MEQGVAKIEDDRTCNEEEMMFFSWKNLLHLSHTNCLFYFVSLCICLTQKNHFIAVCYQCAKKKKKKEEEKTKEANEERKNRAAWFFFF